MDDEYVHHVDPQDRVIGRVSRAKLIDADYCTGPGARGRIRIEHPEGPAEQRFVRAYTKCEDGWRAVWGLKQVN